MYLEDIPGGGGDSRTQTERRTDGQAEGRADRRACVWCKKGGWKLAFGICVLCGKMYSRPSVIG
jgi:hypothetical protein